MTKIFIGKNIGSKVITSVGVILCCLAFNLSANFAVAKQLHYSKTKLENSYQFNYQWLDFQGDAQSLTFELSKEALFDRFRNFRSYRPKIAERSILRTIKKEWQNLDIQNVVVQFPRANNNNGENKISVSGQDQQQVQNAYEKINELEQEARNKYLKDNFYQLFVTYEQVIGIKPNHTDIANVSIDDLIALKPIILEQVADKNIRSVTNFILSFVQSIPYSELESRVSSSGAGFNPPLKLLWENQGDCDSKVTLTVALLRALMPRVPLRLIFIDQHAVMAIAIPQQANDATVVINGVPYVLADPTGPALMPLGQLPSETEQTIYSGHFISELLLDDE